MKNEKQESPAAEILWLRGLRAFVAENSTERLLVEADALDAARAETEADKQALFLRTLTLIERGEKADFYSRVLQYAELRERGEKGGAEQAIRRDTKHNGRKAPRRMAKTMTPRGFFCLPKGGCLLLAG